MDPAEVMYQQFLSLQQPMLEASTRGDSETQRFFNETTVLVTGGTGFLGKILIEKLIRSSKIKQIYVLIRPKKGRPVSERLDMFLEDPVFDQIREKQPSFGQIISPVEGDVMNIGLGISGQDQNMMIETLDIIFHMAATTRFDEPLSKATLINVRGTREVFAMAKQCKKLKSLVHVSTAYCYATRSRVNSELLEKFYKSPIDPEVLIGMVESMDEQRLVAITDKLIDDWPNTYTFTKAVAEEVVRTNAGDLPVCIVRPPVVMPSSIEPSPGWADPSCILGIVGIAVGGMFGIIHVFFIAPTTFNFAPVDFVANAVIVSAYETKRKHDEGDKELKIYTISSRDKFNSDHGYTYNFTVHRYPDDFFSRLDDADVEADVINIFHKKEARVLASPQCMWYTCTHETKNKFVFWVLTLLFHFVPAYILDAVWFFFRLKRPHGIPSFVKMYKKMYKASQSLSYFGLHEWHWRNDNTVRMYKNMSATDKALFNFDFPSLDVTETLLTWALGFRKYIIKDGLKNTATGVRKQFWFKIATFIILAIYASLIVTIVFLIYSTF